MATEILRPNAAGDVTLTTGQFPDSTFHYDKVNEAVADEDETYVYDIDGSAAYRDLYHLPAHSGSGTINFIKVYARCREVSEEGYATIYIKTGGTEYNSAAMPVTVSYANYSHQWNDNPQTEVAWTWDNIDALQIGIGIPNAAAVQARCTQVWVEIDYTPVGWTGKISGVTNPAKIMGVLVANIKSVKGVE